MSDLQVIRGGEMTVHTPLDLAADYAETRKHIHAYQLHQNNLDAANTAGIQYLKACRYLGQALADISNGATHKDKTSGLSETRYVQALKEIEFSQPRGAKYQKFKDVADDRIIAFVEEQTRAAKEVSWTGFYNWLMGTAHVKHNSGDNEWYTPQEYIVAARAVMGKIDLDPCSSEIANETVDAATYYDEDDDGLEQEWSGRVWMNPPYARPLVDKFSVRLIEQLAEGNVKQAITLTNNATDTQWMQALLASAQAVCFHERRVRFLDPQGNPGAPLQGQAFCYFGSKADKFVEVFCSFGVVLRAS